MKTALVMGLYINEEFGATNELNYSGFNNLNKPENKYYDKYDEEL